MGSKSGFENSPIQDVDQRRTKTERISEVSKRACCRHDLAAHPLNAASEQNTDTYAKDMVH